MMTKPLFVTLLALITFAGCSKDPMNMTWEDFLKQSQDKKTEFQTKLGMDKYAIILRAVFEHHKTADTLKMNTMTLKELMEEGSKLPALQ